VAQCWLQEAAMRVGQSGFSLAEILTAVVLVALLAGIAAPNLSALAVRNRLDGATQELAFDLSRARMKAVGENVFCRVRMGNTDSGAVYWLETSDDGVSYDLASALKRLPDGVRFSAMPTEIPRFNRLGLTPATSSISLINGYDQSRLITVNTIGKVTIGDEPYAPVPVEG
jgi:prepilin-type N-terminal cleavage/methylation domain-containing protein